MKKKFYGTKAGLEVEILINLFVNTDCLGI